MPELVPPLVLSHVMAGHASARLARAALSEAGGWEQSALARLLEEADFAFAATQRELDYIHRQERLMAIMRGDVDPYVGRADADGYRRTAQVVLDEIATLDRSDPRRVHLEAEAEAWRQASMRAAREATDAP